MNAAETRAEHIDPALKAAGWSVDDGSRVLREQPITLGSLKGTAGAGRRKGLAADYELVYGNHKLAVIEAKAWHAELTGGDGLARRRARTRGVFGGRVGYGSVAGLLRSALEPLA